ncbi:putative ribonuclease H-like domain-containing protein, partial [Tanacetum coccineum]
MTHPHPKRNFVPIAVVTKSGQVPVNAAKQSSPRVAASISTARPVNIVAPKSKVNDALPITYSYFKAHSPAKRIFNQKSAAKTNNFNEKVNTARVNNVTITGPKAVVSAAVGNGENVVKHMTGNKSFLTDYQEIDDGFVAFGGSPKGGKVTGKGKIRTGKLDFEDVYFVKELKFSWVFFLATKDETCGILKTFITGIENQINHKVKIIRCDNGTEFKNNDMNQFCGMKGIKREFSVARTPQQNGVAERKNRTLIENRVLVTKPHNKTPYELLHGRPPSISFMRPFGCPVTILNTLDPLGKFDGKADEGFFVGYSINSKAFRVFNTRTRKVEENLHITFLENKPNVAGNGPDWLFDIDLLTNSMNYELVTIGNQTNKNTGNKDNGTQQYIMLPLLYNSPQSSEDAVADDAGKKTNEEPTNEGERNSQEKEGGALNKEDDQNVQDFRAKLDNLLVQQKEGYANNTNRDSTISPSVSTAGQNFTNADDLPTDPLMLDLEDTANLLNTGIFSGAYDDEDVGAEADLNNLETTINVSHIPTTIIHKDHSKDHIIRDINSATQTRRMTKISEEHAMVNYIKKKRRTNHKDYQNCLFAYFLSQIEPKKVTQALTDPSWIEAINKKDEGGIVVRNKARLVAQGYTQEEGIDYNEVFAPVVRIEAIRLFLAYASFMGFNVYQMDVKSAFLYGTIEEEIAWYKTLSTYLLENGFRRGTIDKTLFIKKDKGDILLGQVKQKDDGIFISQDKYVADILKKFDFVTMKTASTPIETNKALLKDEEAKDVDVYLYRSMIGSLMYLTASRPNIMFAICDYPRDSPFNLEAFSNSDYAGASLDRKSTTGGCQFLGKRLISWQCKKQTIVANSTTEAEKAKRTTEISQSSRPIHLDADETIYEEWEDRMERAATTASSLEAEHDSEAQIRFEAASKQSNDLPFSRVNILRSGEDIMKLKELMELCTKLSKRILDIKTDR